MEIFLKAIPWWESLYFLYMNAIMSIVCVYPMTTYRSISVLKALWHVPYSKTEIWSMHLEIRLFQWGRQGARIRLLLSWVNGVMEFQNINHFPKGLLSLLHILASQIIEWDIFPEGSVRKRREQKSQHRLLLAEKLFPKIGPRFSSNLTCHGFLSSQLHKEGKGKRGPWIGKGTQTEDTISSHVLQMQQVSSHLTCWIWELDGNEKLH